MYQASEVFMLLVSSGVLIFVAIFFRRIVLIPSWRLLLSAFLLYWTSTVITIVEGYVLPDFLNFMEHLCRALFPLPVLAWCRSVVRMSLPGKDHP